MKKILKWIVFIFFVFSVFSVNTFVNAQQDHPGGNGGGELGDDIKNSRIKEIVQRIKHADIELAKAITASTQALKEVEDKSKEFKNNPTKENAEALVNASRDAVLKAANVNSMARSLEAVNKSLDGIEHTSETEDALKSAQKTIEDANGVSAKASDLMTKSVEALNNPSSENADKVINSLNDLKNSQDDLNTSVSNTISKSESVADHAGAGAGGGGGGYTPGDITSNWCDDPTFKDVCFNNPHNGNPSTLNELIKAILLIVTYISVPLIVLGFAYSAMLFFLAQGKPEELKKAKTILIYSIVGATIIMSAQAIFAIVESTGRAVLDVTDLAD